MPSTSKTGQKVVYGIAAYYWLLIGALLHIYFFLETPLELVQEGIARPYKFICVWNAVLNLVYFNLVVVEEQLGGEKNKVTALIGKFQKHLLFSIISPLTSMACTAYWAVYLYDREMIYPSSIDSYINPHLSHLIHTLPPLLVVLYIWKSETSPPPFLKAFATHCSALVAYFLVLIVSYYEEGKWAYIFLDLLPPGPRISFLIFSFALSTLYFVAGLRINECKREIPPVSGFIKILRISLSAQSNFKS